MRLTGWHATFNPRARNSTHYCQTQSVCPPGSSNSGLDNLLLVNRSFLVEFLHGLVRVHLVEPGVGLESSLALLEVSRVIFLADQGHEDNEARHHANQDGGDLAVVGKVLGADTELFARGRLDLRARRADLETKGSDKSREVSI